MILDRYHGLGNDYLVLVQGPRLHPELVRALCDRHRGVGGDGILEPIPGEGRDEGVRIWNPDGSVAEKSGNGLRIFAQWCVDTGRRGDASFSVWTGACEVTALVAQHDVTIGMGTARFEPVAVPLRSEAPWVDEVVSIEGVSLRVTAVGMGNPHAVVFVREHPDATPWRAWGARLETDERFPNRTNVQVASVHEGRLVARIHERGAGPTLASGSSACAVVAAAVKTGRVPAGLHRVMMEGGEVEVLVDADYVVRLRGPVERVGRIEVDAAWLASRRLTAGARLEDIPTASDPTRVTP